MLRSIGPTMPCDEFDLFDVYLLAGEKELKLTTIDGDASCCSYT